MDLSLKHMFTWLWAKNRKVRRLVNLHRLLRVVKPYTMVDDQRLIVLYGLACEAASISDGDFVECGVCNGGTAAVLGTAVRDLSSARLLLFDTFEGLPPPGPVDGPKAPGFDGKLKGSVENVKAVLRKVRFPSDRTEIHKGLFCDTFQHATTRKVALLHIDADWYESVYTCLERFYPLVDDGGVIVIDDFGFWEGAREAVHDYCHAHGIKPLIERVGYWQGFWRKGVQHNRVANRELCWPRPHNRERRLSLMYQVMKA